MRSPLCAMSERHQARRQDNHEERACVSVTAETYFRRDVLGNKRSNLEGPVGSENRTRPCDVFLIRILSRVWWTQSADVSVEIETREMCNPSIGCYIFVKRDGQEWRGSPRRQVVADETFGDSERVTTRGEQPRHCTGTHAKTERWDGSLSMVRLSQTREVGMLV